MELVNYILHVPAASWYHLAAFFLTGAGNQYTVQLIKVVSGNKYGKWTLRFLNGAFAAIYTGAAALVTGGMGLGNYAKTTAALATLSVVIYRIHNSLLYKSGAQIVSTAVADVGTTAAPAITGLAQASVTAPAPATPASAFSGDPE